MSQLHKEWWREQVPCTSRFRWSVSRNIFNNDAITDEARVNLYVVFPEKYYVQNFQEILQKISVAMEKYI